MKKNNQPGAAVALTFPDILRMFRGKGKTVITIMVIALIIGAIAGAAYSFVFASHGASVTFYVSPRDGSQVVIPLLNSDSFYERLLLDENGLPPKEECDPEDYEAALAAVTALNTARADKYELAKEITLFNSEFSLIQDEYNNLVTAYNDIFNELELYLSAQDEIAKGEAHAETIAKYESELSIAKQARDSYKTEKYLPAKAKNVAYADEMVRAKRTVSDLRDEAESALEKVVAPWRETPEVQESIRAIRNSVTFEYAQINEELANVANSEENQNAAFIVAKVSVQGDEDLAKDIVESIKTRLPYFVENHLERLTGSHKARCTLTSTFADITVVDGESTVVSAAIGGIIGALLVGVIYCAVVVVYNMLPPDLIAKKEKKSKKEKSAEEA